VAELQLYKEINILHSLAMLWGWAWGHLCQL